MNEYDVPFVRPETVHELDDVSQTTSPAATRTTYFEIDAPPVETGAVHDTTDRPFAALVADTPEGASGTVDGTIAEDATEAEPVPEALVAVTVNV